MDLSKLFKDIVNVLTQKTMFYGFYRYRVVAVKSTNPGDDYPRFDRLDLQAVGSVEGLPDQLAIDKAHGSPGLSEENLPGTLVLVGFEGGDPGVPFIAHYLLVRDPPPQSRLDALNELDLGHTTGHIEVGFSADLINIGRNVDGLHVLVGDGDKPVALAGPLNTWASTVHSYMAYQEQLNALVVGILDPGATNVPLQTAKANTAIWYALESAAFGLGSNAYGGWTSTVLAASNRQVDHLGP